MNTNVELPLLDQVDPNSEANLTENQQVELEVEQAKVLAEAQQLIEQQWQILSEHLKMMDFSIAGGMPLNDMLQKNMDLIQANTNAFMNTQNQQQANALPSSTTTDVEPPMEPEQQSVHTMDLGQLSQYMDSVLLQSAEQINKVTHGPASSFNLETNE